MRPHLRSCVLIFAVALSSASGVLGQGSGAPAQAGDQDGPRIRFNGHGRSFMQQTSLGGTLLDSDTTTVENFTNGEFLLDLAVNAQPNEVTEVQGIIRFRNEFGGFFGAGVSVEVRELWARGVIADVLRYRVGDIDLALTPYTLFLPEEDGVVNTPDVFRPLRQIIYHEEFYAGFNQRRLQGAHVDFGLEFDRGLEAVEVKSFVARLRTTNFTDTPNRFVGGGRVAAISPRFGRFRMQGRLGGNLAYTWDDLDSGDANTGIRNAVFTVDTDLTVLDQDPVALRVVGEAGRSSVTLKRGGDEDRQSETLIDESDTFVELGLAANIKGPGIGLSVQFVDVGPEFFSSAAQSKRVDYTRRKTFYNRIGNDLDLRKVTLFDLTRDPALYTFRIANELMAYDPRYSNVLPYGRATPNRRGVRLDAAYRPTDSPFQATLDLAFLREIRGQGTTELKDFVLVRAAADVALHTLFDWRRSLALTLGTQFETTSRDGLPVEQVNLTSTFFEAGVTAEVYDRLDVLLGTKLRSSSGRDYVPTIENFNDVRDFPAPFVSDDRETLLGAGIRYRFKDEVYLTIQYQHFSYGNDATPDADYNLGQIFVLYSMSF